MHQYVTESANVAHSAISLTRSGQGIQNCSSLDVERGLLRIEPQPSSCRGVLGLYFETVWIGQARGRGVRRVPGNVRRFLAPTTVERRETVEHRPERVTTTPTCYTW